MNGRFARAVCAVLRDDRGSTLAEYAMLSATLGLAMLAGVALLRTNAGNELTAIANGWLSVAQAPP
jgi:Flp pilus assembly pilin Flp